MDQKQLSCVQELARQVAALAGDPQMERTRQRWRDTYMLRHTDRAPVWLRLDGMGQRELLPEDSLQCGDPFLRPLERQL
ncbi:hypothetical protein ACFL6X_02925, partial [Candidatus Latescibacterota bacterium]